MILTIISLESYPKEDKTYYSAITGDGQSVNISKEQFETLKPFQNVYVASRKLRTKDGKFFTLKSIVPVQLGA